MRAKNDQRGSSLIFVMGILTVILVIVAGLMLYTHHERIRSIIIARKSTRLSCVQAGLQLARAYYGRNFNQWNTFLSNPSIYDPIQSSFNPTPANPGYNLTTRAVLDPTLRANHPELFADLDGDGLADVYIYMRDNLDELPSTPGAPMPAANWQRDNDQNIIVGAMCISLTMGPRLESGTSDPTQLTLEGMLAFNYSNSGCYQAYCGDGSGNQN